MDHPKLRYRLGTLVYSNSVQFDNPFNRTQDDLYVVATVVGTWSRSSDNQTINNVGAEPAEDTDAATQGYLLLRSDGRGFARHFWRCQGMVPL